MNKNCEEFIKDILDISLCFTENDIKIIKDGSYISINSLSTTERIIINISVRYSIKKSEYILNHKYNVFIIDDCFDFISPIYIEKILPKMSKVFSKIIILGKNMKKYQYKIENGIIKLVDK